MFSYHLMRASYVTASVTICTFVHSCIMQVRFHTKSVPALSSNEFPMGKQNNGNWNTQTRQHCFSTIIAYLGFFFAHHIGVHSSCFSKSHQSYPTARTCPIVLFILPITLYLCYHYTPSLHPLIHASPVSLVEHTY